MTPVDAGSLSGSRVAQATIKTSKKSGACWDPRTGVKRRRSSTAGCARFCSCAAAVSNFVVTPLSLLSGTFYSVHSLAPAFQAVSHANPFFYIISGFRAGFLGVSDSPLLVGGLALRAPNLVMFAFFYAPLRGGWQARCWW